MTLITVICPIHKHKYLNTITNNFSKQLYENKELLLIMNGDLYNLSLNHLVKTIRINSSNIADIRNSGLDWMQKNNRKVFAFMDSDDWYSENYLSEAYDKLSEGYDIVGKLDYSFYFDGDIYTVNGFNNTNDPNIQGPTMFGYLSDIRFDSRFNNLAEDIDFIQKHKRIGRTSSDNWIYNAREDSIQKRSFTKFLEGIKFVSTQRKIDLCINKNDEVIWRFGDGFDISKLI